MPRETRVHARTHTNTHTHNMPPLPPLAVVLEWCGSSSLVVHHLVRQAWARLPAWERLMACMEVQRGEEGKGGKEGETPGMFGVVYLVGR